MVPLYHWHSPHHQTQTPQHRTQPGRTQTSARTEGVVEEEKPRNKEEAHHDVAGEEEEDDEDEDEGENEEEDEDDEEEREELDVLGSGSEGEAPSPQPINPNRPSDPQPPSGKQEEEYGWVTKKKRLPRPKAAPASLDPPKVPKHRRTTKPSIALHESPTITRLSMPSDTSRRETTLLRKGHKTRNRQHD
ncbi:hypothetical protein E2C01_032347 [Portunus trituberculatus]|uniref:Uncharacterized protein n=1 Tax=Portunus trituberculatus TaxID=210409 RepID=A0A5B7EX94_PORTR|nr:hypothetical protein [Portunus trituberculatus]